MDMLINPEVTRLMPGYRCVTLEVESDCFTLQRGVQHTFGLYDSCNTTTHIIQRLRSFTKQEFCGKRLHNVFVIVDDCVLLGTQKIPARTVHVICSTSMRWVRTI